MQAAAFLAEFNARFSCSLRLLDGREWNQVGRQQEVGTGCADCSGCETRNGEMGSFGEFVLERHHGVLQLRWPCPECGVTVSEETSPLSAWRTQKRFQATLCVTDAVLLEGDRNENSALRSRGFHAKQRKVHFVSHGANCRTDSQSPGTSCRYLRLR